MIEKTLWAVTGTLLTGRQSDPVLINQAGMFLLRQRRRMPDLIRWALGIVTLFFGLSSLIFHCKPFWALNLEQRRVHLGRWAGSSVAPLRDYTRLVASLVTLAAYEERD